jgi:hypothetical protein
VSIEKSPDRIGPQQFQHKPRRNVKIAVDLPAMELDFQQQSRFLVANPPQFRRLDRLSQHAISSRMETSAGNLNT